MKRCLLLTSLTLSLAASGCTGAGGTPAATIKPKQLTVSEAMNKSELACSDPNDEAEILVVDLPASRRGDIEILMQEGLIAVNYDCNKLKILKGCQIEGGYAYKGILLKEEVLRLENSDEIRANLPLSGAGVVAKMEGELGRGATLDLATVMVGQQRAARYEVGHDELSGRCDKATHFVQSIYVGAFAMQRGERAKAAATLDIFGSGTSAGSSSTNSTRESDGDITACRRTKADAKTPEVGCGTPLRLYMVPISPAGTKPKQAAPKESYAVHLPGCPKGMTYVGGKCTQSKGPSCTAKTPKACQDSCKAGDARSCGVFGLAQRYGKHVPKSHQAAGLTFARGCELGDASSCYHLGLQYRIGKGVTKDFPRSITLAERGCALGDGDACFLIGVSYMQGEGVEVDQKRGFSAYEQGCAAGNAASCTNLGKAYSVGTGVAPDVVHSFKLYVRACEAGNSQACFNVGVRYGKGKGTEQSDAKRIQFYRRACGLDHGKACYRIAQVDKDPTMMKKACKLGYEKACNMKEKQ